MVATKQFNILWPQCAMRQAFLTSNTIRHGDFLIKRLTLFFGVVLVTAIASL
jgi:hypothetical protein